MIFKKKTAFLIPLQCFVIDLGKRCCLYVQTCCLYTCQLFRENIANKIGFVMQTYCYICTARQRQQEKCIAGKQVKLGYHIRLIMICPSLWSMIIFSQPHQLLAKGPLHTACTTISYFLHREKEKQQVYCGACGDTQSTVLPKLLYWATWCTLHLRLRYLLEEGWASPMEIYMIRASIGLAVPGLPL